MSFKYQGKSKAPAPSRKRGYRTFTKDIEEGGQDVINLDGDDDLPPIKKQKRTIEVIDFTRDDDDGDDEDKPFFSPSVKHRMRPSSTHDKKLSTCVSCDVSKSKDSFPTEDEQDERSLTALGGVICRRCWEANFFAERAHEAEKQEQECSICYDTASADRFPTRPHGAHDHTVCISCWERHLHTEIERKAWDKLSCPQDGCGQVLTYGEIAVLDGGFETAIEPILAVKATASYLQQDAAYFACPSADCKSGNILDDTDHGIFTCEACSFSSCLDCQVAIHTGQSCEGYQDSINGNARRKKQKEQEEKDSNFVDSKSRTCTCGAKLQKISGCDHVTCLACKKAFNWSSLPAPKKIRKPATKKKTAAATAATSTTPEPDESEEDIPTPRDSGTGTMLDQLRQQRPERRTPWVPPGRRAGGRRDLASHILRGMRARREAMMQDQVRLAQELRDAALRDQLRVAAQRRETARRMLDARVEGIRSRRPY